MNDFSFDTAPNSLDAYWMPFTPNRAWKRDPRFVTRAQGMHYVTPEGRQVLDAIAGLWCVNAGHTHPKIVEAIRAQAGQLDFASSFGLGHPAAFEYANRLTEVAPEGFNRVFFTSSGSEAVDTALKLALAHHSVRGEGQRVKLIGRQRSYHGVNFGGLSVAGIGMQRKHYGPLLPGVSHLPHTHDPARNAFSRGRPEHGGIAFAEALEGIVQAQDPSTIAAVIVEPVAGSSGVLVPPVGYLERLREICDRHGLLLIFDEVVTGFGRLGAPFGSQALGVMPDLICCAKGMTNGAVPMGGVLANDRVAAGLMSQPEGVAEFMHGYTYSGHPLAAAAAMATLQVYQEEGLFQRAADIAGTWEAAVHGLRDAPGVTDIRNIGLLAAIEFAPQGDKPSPARAVAARCFDKGVLIRAAGDSLVLSPPLIISADQIDEIVDTIRWATQAG
ncbi:aminotransferase class III-fold pyridoxal phosphate-dependent enzyme [Roseomonas sp. SSH11]|uniref:Aminotransferase class III-fold pyridoxal phosphate-dependent enzyme n=1 Tax=Pararoseomonas baculiformis TaxID=2820812 RepID=A0ABS4AHB8_9PROT|nr:aminotransferase class III-fold pyridoxal phosphate-dependent enzyme [Pararoseomonas baculiformis]MBP0445930.1 aminotransferase class III-fold pyridoxal phosphate-dependent enzyme [Pararoseomonas baculiformis]